MTLFDDTLQYKNLFFRIWYLFSAILFAALILDNEDDKFRLVSNFITYDTLTYTLIGFSVISFFLNLFASFYQTKGIFVFYSLLTPPLLPYNIYYMIKNKTF